MAPQAARGGRYGPAAGDGPHLRPGFDVGGGRRGSRGAAYGDARGSGRTGAGGYRERRWDTRADTIDLGIPKLRRGSYFPSWLLDPRRRSERALHQVVAECLRPRRVHRKVEGLVRALGTRGISRSQVSELAGELDEEVREAGRVVNAACVMATGVTAGRRSWAWTW
ncbi:MAG TPA: transposase [Actinomycetota bacterium]|nr:transposase [Actinomycetota bacterium]